MKLINPTRNRFLFFTTLLVFSLNNIQAQTSLKVLFLGNSYTGVNNLPQLVHDVALSAGDTLNFEMNTPGGYTLLDHNADNISRAKIMSPGWNYVVLQGQSQEPVSNPSNFGSGAYLLNKLITQYNVCSVTQYYMTWGRKNGDSFNCQFFPEMCSYEGMDSALRRSYLNAANATNAEVSPVSVVWHYLRTNYPALELYQSDESHPSLAGSYAAACCFYTTLFKKDPTSITFNSGVLPADAAIIRDAVKTTVFNQLAVWDLKHDTQSAFEFMRNSGINQISFFPRVQTKAEHFLWDFGDGTTDTLENPVHSFATNGTFTVSLTTTNCDLQGLHTSTSDTIIQFCNHTPSIYTANPWLCGIDTLYTQVADSYQWLHYGVPIPEYNQTLVNYARYNGGAGFSVISTVNGCSELSEFYNETPQWSGYYFDFASTLNPCNGDTVPFSVLHINGFLNGSEIIMWYINDTLIPALSNQDTLLISAPGKYACKIINPLSNCPWDTTAYSFTLNCTSIGIHENQNELLWSVHPNPAKENLFIDLKDTKTKTPIEIYNAFGQLIETQLTSGKFTVDISSWPKGIYFIRIKNRGEQALKFVKE